jgi:riboflavin synthase
MFTGIIEALGSIQNIENEGTNIHFTIKSNLAKELKIDQSVAHNGVCLTVTDCNQERYKVTAIQETLQKTNLGKCQIGNKLNLERAMIYGARLDGHLVQGHVDAVAQVQQIENKEGSWLYTINYPEQFKALMIEKGSICLNGISLTCFNLKENAFQVAIIPYTYEHTQIHTWNENDDINIEFDLLGKYMARHQELINK